MTGTTPREVLSAASAAVLVGADGLVNTDLPMVYPGESEVAGDHSSG